MLLAPLLLAIVSAPQEAPADEATRARALPLPELRVDELDRWREHVKPTGSELAFEEIAWLPDFAAGVRRSAEEQRPLLFWAMNGHPLACT